MVADDAILCVRIILGKTKKKPRTIRTLIHRDKIERVIGERRQFLLQNIREVDWHEFAHRLHRTSFLSAIRLNICDKIDNYCTKTPPYQNADNVVGSALRVVDDDRATAHLQRLAQRQHELAEVADAAVVVHHAHASQMRHDRRYFSRQF